jgi:putative SOS response-associated peptidase YedK
MIVYFRSRGAAPGPRQGARMCYSIEMVEQYELAYKRFKAVEDEEALKALADKIEKYTSKRFKTAASDRRIFPNYWAPALIEENGRRLIRPMRYRLRPSWSAEEIPARYNLFNARLDALEERRSWRELFMKRHGLVLLGAFYEWVENEAGKKVVLRFAPETEPFIVAPILHDTWGRGEERLDSFAVITSDPTPEVQAVGHDRCPVFLRESAVDDWLCPGPHSKARIYDLLRDQQPVLYKYKLAA